MTALLFRIQALPQELQDLIAEFNTDHRPQMFPVHRQIMQIPHAPLLKRVHLRLVVTIPRYGAESCYNCTNWIEEYEKVVSSVCGDTYVYCSDYCQFDTEYYMRKRMRNCISNGQTK